MRLSRARLPTVNTCAPASYTAYRRCVIGEIRRSCLLSANTGVTWVWRRSKARLKGSDVCRTSVKKEGAGREGLIFEED